MVITVYFTIFLPQFQGAGKYFTFPTQPAHVFAGIRHEMHGKCLLCIDDKNEERRSRTLLQLLRDSSLSEGAMSWCDFRLCATGKASTKSGFLMPKVCAFKTKDFHCRFFCTPQSDADRLPSFKEGSCRRRRLRGVAVRKESYFCRRRLCCFGLSQGIFLRQHSSSTVAFLREEGGTRERDGRSLRD